MKPIPQKNLTTGAFCRADTLVSTVILVGLALLLLPLARKFSTNGHDTLALIVRAIVVFAILLGCVDFAWDCIVLRRSRRTKR